MKIAIIDIDGVLADFEGWLTDRMVDEFGRIVGSVKRNKYSWVDRWGDFPDALERAAKLTQDKHSYHGVGQLLDGVRFVKELSSLEVPILYITSRPKDSHHITARWLQRNVWRFDDAVGLQVVADKAEHIDREFHLSEIAFVVDDNPDTCAYLNNHGFLCFAWRQPWNEGVFPAIIPTRDTFYVVENDEDEGADFLLEVKEMKYG